jgi:uroporphyrinogen decarboxylase
MSKLYIEAGMDIVAVVDPLVSQISPEHFKAFLTGPFTELFEYIKERNAFSSFFVCGNATRNIEEMCLTKPDNIAVDENVNMAAAKAITDRYNIVIGGNIPLTTVMLHGTQQDNMKAVIDLLDSVSDRRGLVVSPGCDMPYHVLIENIIGSVQAVWDEAGVREILTNYVAAQDDTPVTLPDYPSLTKPLIEMFMLDSKICAACTYMKEAADVAKAHFGDAIDVVEYKVTLKENVARAKAMKVPSSPSMYINGELVYRSIIPSRGELFHAIEEAIRSRA